MMPSGEQAAREQLVEQQYERLWTGVLEKAQELVEAGERDLKRVHLLMRRNFGSEFNDAALAAKYLEHERKKAASGFLYDRQLIKVIDADPRVITLMTDAVKMRASIDAMGPDVERIVELGSGWAKVLFNLYLYGAPAKAEYLALELTQTGRRVTELIASQCAPAMRIGTHYFNYYQPAFPMLAQLGKTAFITHHSIEQIPSLDVAVIEAMLAAPGFHRAIHLEPCGFQIPGSHWLDGPKAEMQRIEDENRRFSEKKNQNRNLYPLLRGLEQQGRLRIHAVRKFFTSHLLANATSLIVWGPPEAAAEADTNQRDDLDSLRQDNARPGWMRFLPS